MKKCALINHVKVSLKSISINKLCFAMFAVNNFVQNVSVKYMNRNVGILKYLL